MENRRQTYRHSFEPREILRAELYRPGQHAVLACEVLDLSLGGMRARLRQPVGSLGTGDSIVTRLYGRESSSVDLSLSLPSEVAFLIQHGEVWHCGLHFLPLADTRVRDDIERTLSRFLFDEQRRRKMKNAS
jgi:c-di-GMP-binding flagellar brake protein YcgR